MSEVDGATLIARSLKQQGIDHLFGIVGFPVDPIAAAAQKEGINYLGMRNEQSAAYAAAAYGYLTGRPGACLTVTGPGVVHGLAGLANAQQNCWPMILIGGASETYRGGMGAFQEERQVLIASPFCKFAHGIESVQRIPYYVEMATRHAIYGRPGATYLDMPDDIIRGKCELDKVVEVQRVPEPPRMVAPGENVEAALNVLEKAERPLVHRRQGHGVVARRGRGARLHRAHPDAVRALADGQGRDAGRPSAVGRRGAHAGAAAGRRRLPDGRAVQLDLPFRPGAALRQGRQGHPARHRARGDRPQQADRSGAGRRRQGDRRPAQQGARQAASGSIPRTRRGARRSSKKIAENAATIKPQIDDDAAPANYYRALRDVAAWMPKNAILSAEGAGTMDIGLTQLPSFDARSCLNAGTYGTMGVGLGQAIAACVAQPGRPVIHLSGDSAIGFSGMEMETLVRYDFPVKIVVLNNGGIGPGMPEIPDNPMMNLKPNALIYGARYDRMMEAFGGKGFFVEDPKDIRGALDEAMKFDGPALVNVVLSQGSTRKAQEFAWHS